MKIFSLGLLIALCLPACKKQVDAQKSKAPARMPVSTFADTIATSWLGLSDQVDESLGKIRTIPDAKP